MDTHISELARQQDPPQNRVRARVFLPGEAGARPAPPHESPVLDGGEATVTADPAERLTASPPAGRPRRRPWLLATTAVLVIAGVGAGFLLSPYNTIFYPADTARLRTQGQNLASAASAAVADLVAPSARVARAPQPVQLPPPQRQVVVAPSSDEQMREILALRDRSKAADASSTAPATAPPVAPPAVPAPSPVAPPPPAASPAAPSPGLTQRPEGGPRVVPATSAARRPDPLQTPSLPPLAVFETGATPGAVVPSQAPLIPEGTTGGAAGPATPPPSVPAIPSAIDPAAPSGQGFEPAIPVDGIAAPAPYAPPAQAVPAIAMAMQTARVAPTVRSLSTQPEIVSAVAELRAAPMTPAQQVEVLNLVAKLGVVVRDMRAENAALKSRVESTADRFDAAVTDFDRRLALAEARGAVNAAMGASPAPTAPAPEAAVPNPGRPARVGAGTGAGVQVVPVSTIATASGSAVPRYRVTAASPGLAMLSLLDRSGGEGSQLQVAVGDQVPGYGRVSAIQQRGSSWIVQTDKGPDKGVIQ